jgi:hypothetical protein
MVDDRFQRSKYMLGSPGKMVDPGSSASANLLIDTRKYSYEGNWLFCSFSRPDLPAARIGFGRGKFDWRDYGIESLPVSQDAFFYRVEVIKDNRLYACVLSDPSLGSALQSDPERLQIALDSGGHRVLSLEGWPQSRWRFQNLDGSLKVNLSLDVRRLVIWPDMLLPHNTFSMCVGTGILKGTVHLEGTEVEVKGTGCYDHPRTVVEPNGVPPFGWYLYTPVGFADGAHVLTYHCVDGLGHKDNIYSQGFLVLPDGRSFWLTESNVHGLSLSTKGLPLSWESEMAAPGVLVRYQVKVADLRLARGWGDAAPDAPPGKYDALPLLMRAEGECTVGGARFPLSKGTGIAEFVVRAGYQPLLP